MALSIKSDKADRLARDLAAVTGESLTDAVVHSLQERLDRVQGQDVAERVDRLRRLQARVAELRVADGRTAEEIIGYDELGLPT